MNAKATSGVSRHGDRNHLVTERTVYVLTAALKNGNIHYHQYIEC